MGQRRWNKRELLSSKLLKLSLVRKRTTVGYGGFDEVVNRYLNQDLIPNLLRDLNEIIKDMLQGLIETEILDETSIRRSIILKEIYKAEVRDKEFGQFFNSLKPSFDQLKSRIPSKQWKIPGSRPSPPTQLSVQRLKKAIAPQNLKRNHYRWMSCQSLIQSSALSTNSL